MILFFSFFYKMKFIGLPINSGETKRSVNETKIIKRQKENLVLAMVIHGRRGGSSKTQTLRSLFVWSVDFPYRDCHSHPDTHICNWAEPITDLLKVWALGFGLGLCRLRPSRSRSGLDCLVYIGHPFDPVPAFFILKLEFRLLVRCLKNLKKNIRKKYKEKK